MDDRKNLPNHETLIRRVCATAQNQFAEFTEEKLLYRRLDQFAIFFAYRAVSKSSRRKAARCLSTMKKLFSQLSPSGLATVLLTLLVLAAVPSIAQNIPTSDTPAVAASGIAVAPQKMSRYVATHEGSKSVFRRDPNIWVMTPELAERSGMPKEWASTELKGVAAAAFRREPEGAEQDCGFGGNKNACRPVINCVLELYFDRNAHVLPWREGAPVADFNTYQGSSWTHLFFGGVPDPISGATGRRNQLIALQPFIDPVSAAGLFWWWTSPVYMAGTGKARVMAYDREIHGSFAYLKLDTGYSGKDINGESLVLQLRDARRNVLKQFHEIYFPASWTKRVDDLSKSTRQQEESFYKSVFESINAKDGEKK